MVDDEARQGALRFAEQPGSPFLREPDASRIPPLLELPRLLSAAEHVVDEKDTDEDLRLLFAPGSSLGGARPKASVRLKDGSLAIAKFPRRDDEITMAAWEAVALMLARKAGIATPAARLEDVAGKPVLVLTRFDRVKGRRKPFLSAMSMLGAKDNESRSYLEFVDVLRRSGAAPVEDSITATIGLVSVVGGPLPTGRRRAIEEVIRVDPWPRRRHPCRDRLDRRRRPDDARKADARLPRWSVDWDGGHPLTPARRAIEGSSARSARPAPA